MIVFFTSQFEKHQNLCTKPFHIQQVVKFNCYKKKLCLGSTSQTFFPRGRAHSGLFLVYFCVFLHQSLLPTGSKHSEKMSADLVPGKSLPRWRHTALKKLGKDEQVDILLENSEWGVTSVSKKTKEILWRWFPVGTETLWLVSSSASDTKRTQPQCSDRSISLTSMALH